MDDQSQHTLTKEEAKAAFKEAVKESIREGVEQFGWFSVKTIFMLIMAALIYLFVATHGFKIL